MSFCLIFRNYSRCEAELNIILPTGNNFDIKQKKHEKFVL